MTKQDLLQLELLLEKFNESYSDEIHRAGYRELKTLASTVNGIILEGKYEKDKYKCAFYGECAHTKRINGILTCTYDKPDECLYHGETIKF